LTATIDINIINVYTQTGIREERTTKQIGINLPGLGKASYWFQRSLESPMRFFIAPVILLFSLYAVSLLNAQKLYTWTDENGILHITDQPPPDWAEVIDVETYKERTPAELEAIERIKNKEQREFDRYLQRENEREAALKARKADENAQKAREQAEKDYDNNKAYIDKLSNRRWKRKKFRKRIERLRKETEESFAQAKSAAEQAGKAKGASEESRLTSEEGEEPQ